MCLWSIWAHVDLYVASLIKFYDIVLVGVLGFGDYLYFCPRNVVKSSKIVRIATLITLIMVLLTVDVYGGGGVHPLDSRLVPGHVAEAADTLQSGGKHNWWRENSTYETQFRPVQLIAPISFITVGALGVGERAPLRGVCIDVNDRFYALSGGKPLRFDDYIQYLPVGLYLTLDYMGLEAKHSLGERVAVAAVTYIAAAGLTQGVKHIVREPRPFSARRNSFPSGHTTTAFAGAELVRTEYGWGVGMGAYAVAATVGVMRMYNGKHWLNDVVAGMGFGILSARIGYWMLPLNRHIFKIPRKGQALVATPMYNAEVGALGVACAVQF